VGGWIGIACDKMRHEARPLHSSKARGQATLQVRATAPNKKHLMGPCTNLQKLHRRCKSSLPRAGAGGKTFTRPDVHTVKSETRHTTVLDCKERAAAPSGIDGGAVAPADAPYAGNWVVYLLVMG
jgi:hypothetical protein